MLMTLFCWYDCRIAIDNRLAVGSIHAYRCASRFRRRGAGHFEDVQLFRVHKDHIALLKP